MQSLKHETQAIQAQAEAIAELRMELIEDLNGLGPLDAFCRTCKTTEGLRDSEECWACYDAAKQDAEMFARHGGDV